MFSTPQHPQDSFHLVEPSSPLSPDILEHSSSGESFFLGTAPTDTLLTNLGGPLLSQHIQEFQFRHGSSWIPDFVIISVLEYEESLDQFQILKYCLPIIVEVKRCSHDSAPNAVQEREYQASLAQGDVIAQVSCLFSHMDQGTV